MLCICIDFFKEIRILKVDMFLVEKANKDYLIQLMFTWSVVEN